jgi:ABC-2 type transport system ATP-binding protein
LFIEEDEMSPAVYVSNIFKKFGKPDLPVIRRFSRWNGKLGEHSNDHQPVVVALDHVSFTVQEGEIFGVLGPYGSGKSTLIRLLAALLLPDEGDIRIFGYDVVRQAIQVQRLINPVSADASFFKQLSPFENLFHGARMHGMSAAQARRRIVDILTQLGLEGSALNRPMEEVSRCVQQKVAIARALLSRPPLLLLDEPYDGLDPGSKRDVHRVIRQLRHEHGTTVLFTTRDALEAEALGDRIVALDHGKIAALQSPEEFRWPASSVVGEPALESVC